MSAEFNSDYPTQISLEEWRQLNRAHRQGFNHDEIVEQHRQEEEAELLAMIEEAAKQRIAYLTTLEEDIKKVEAQADVYQKDPNHPLVVLTAQVELLKSSCETFETHLTELTTQVNSTRNELIRDIERIDRLRAVADQMKRRVDILQSQYQNRYSALNSGKTLIGSAGSWGIAQKSATKK